MEALPATTRQAMLDCVAPDPESRELVERDQVALTAGDLGNVRLPGRKSRQRAPLAPGLSFSEPYGT
jgi:hypothetical protein